MKRLFLAMITAALALANCAAKQGLPERLRIASGGTSGVYYACGEALGAALERDLGVPVTVLATGGSVENIALVQDGKADLAFVQNDVMTYAWEGSGPFAADGPRKGFSAAAGLYPEFCQIVARPGMASVRDLAGRAVSLGDVGGGTELNALQILAGYGLDEADVKARRLDFAASVAAFEAGEIDGFFLTAGVPTPAVSALSGGVTLLPVGEAHARALIAGYPFYTAQVIPAGSYPGVTEDIPAVAVRAALIASEKLSAEAVEKITASLFANAAGIEAASGKALSRRLALYGLPIPLHPGAERYYRGEQARP